MTLAPVRTASMSRYFGVDTPLIDEHDLEVEQVDGAIPKELSGSLLRIGPGKLQVGTTPLDNLFDGDGMVSRFAISDGRVHFRNRFVRTKHFRHGQSSSAVRYRGLGAMRPGGRLANLLRIPANVANTSVMLHGEEILALWEGGKPHRVDFDSLDTRGLEHFGLRWLGGFSAHPKLDPRTGELFNFGLDFFPTPGLRCFRRDRAGRMHTLARIRLPDLGWNHDFALTEDYLVFVLDPIVPDFGKLLGGRETYMESLEYRPEKGSRFVLVPRAGGKPRIVEHDALLHFHVTNAYQEGGDVVVDLVDYGDAWPLLRTALGAARAEFAPPESRLLRYRISASGRVTCQPISSYACEFPQLDGRRTTLRNRFSYAQSRGASAYPEMVMKVDHDTGTTTTHALAGHTFGEPLFVPRHDDAAEDDGWLLTMAHDHGEDRTKLVVLDARDLERDALAVAHLPFNVPLGFHGLFTPRLPVRVA